MNLLLSDVTLSIINVTIGLTKVNKGYLFDNIEFLAIQ